MYKNEGSEGAWQHRITDKENVQVCFVRTDSKVKKVAFYFSQHGDGSEDTATVSTIEAIGERIEGLEDRLS